MELNLCDCLRVFLESRMTDVVLPTRGSNIETPGESRQLKFIDSYLPIKNNNSDDPYPFVMVRADSSVAESEKLQIVVSIIVGTFAADSVGFRDALNVCSRIRNEILPFTQTPLDQKFHLLQKIEWDTLTDDQPWPYWQMGLKTTWAIDFPINKTGGLPNTDGLDDYNEKLKNALYG